MVNLENKKTGHEIMYFKFKEKFQTENESFYDVIMIFVECSVFSKSLSIENLTYEQIVL